MSKAPLSNRRTYVMVPGGGHGGWAWQPVAERLCTAGHNALTITLPGMGVCADRSTLRLRDASRHVITEIDRIDSDSVILVGHSLGGLIIATVAAELGRRIEELVFVSAWVPSTGESFASNNTDIAPAQHSPGASDAGVGKTPFESFAASVMQGLPEPAQRIVYNLTTPTPPGYLLDPYPGPELNTLNIPTRYIVGADDRALVCPATESASRLGVEPIVIPGTHEVLLTHPDELAQAILAGH